MIISIDIDGVLCQRNNRAYIKACNRVLKLGISEEDIEHISYREFLARPELAAYREAQGAEIAERALKWMYYHPLALGQATVLSGALQGITALQRYAMRICYHTARYSQDPWWNSKMQKATRAWLETNAFPEPESVVFCQNYQDKALQLQRLSETFGPVLHIDDNWKELRSLIDPRVTLVAFGASGDAAGLSLPSWGRMDVLLAHIQERIQSNV